MNKQHEASNFAELNKIRTLGIQRDYANAIERGELACEYCGGTFVKGNVKHYENCPTTV